MVYVWVLFVGEDRHILGIFRSLKGAMRAGEGIEYFDEGEVVWSGRKDVFFARDGDLIIRRHEVSE